MTAAQLVVLLVQCSAASYMVGFIWTMQVLHYPQFDRVGRDTFAIYEREHNRRFGLLVGPGIVVVAVTAVVQLMTRPPTTSLIAVLGELVLLGVIVVSTVRYQAPQHGKPRTRRWSDPTGSAPWRGLRSVFSICG